MRKKTDAEVHAALQASGGEVKRAAVMLGISRQALHERLVKKAYLRWIPNLNKDSLDFVVLRVQALELLVDCGDISAAKQILEMHDRTEKRHVAVRPYFSDALVEELITFLGGDVSAYWESRLKMSGTQKLSLSRRRVIVEIAAAVALKMPPSQVWRTLKRAWVEFENQRYSFVHTYRAKMAQFRKQAAQTGRVHGVE